MAALAWRRCVRSVRAARHAAEKKGVSSAIQRTTRQSPYKMRLVIDQIRGKDVNEALGLLKFSKKHAAKQIEKVLRSAVANAEHARETSRAAILNALREKPNGKDLERHFDALEQREAA